jgi:hypothetical protein
MTDVTRAKRVEIELGDNKVEVFQLPSGEYKLSQTQVAGAVDKAENSFREFLKSKSLEALPYKNFKSVKLSIEGARKPINVIPIKLAVAYWTKETLAGNGKAARLLAASADEAIQRRADNAFGISRTESEYNRLFKRTFEGLGLVAQEFEYLQKCSNDSELYDDKTYKFIKPLLKGDFKNPVFGMGENEFRDDLASLSARTNRWRLRIEDELAFEFEGDRNYSYPDLISDVFLCSASLDGVQQKVVFIFECKNPIVKVGDIKECLYDRQYLEAAREKYETEHIFIFFVAPLGGEPKAYSYIDKRLSPDDEGYIRIITVKKMAEFLKSQLSTVNPTKKGEVQKRYRKLLNYQIATHSSLPSA